MRTIKPSTPAKAGVQSTAKPIYKCAHARSGPRPSPGWAWMGVVFFMVLAAPALAVEPDEMLKDPALEARALALTHNLRCPVCLGQDVDGSNAPLAADIRRAVRQMVSDGRDDAYIYDFMRARYGDAAVLTPPVAGRTRILWLGPFAVLAAGFFCAGVFIWRQNRGKS